MATGSPAPENGSGKLVRLQLSTKQSNIALPQHQDPILVPTNARRHALSLLVNDLLGYKSKSQRIPFDFLINGTILRISLDEYLTRNGISAETVLQAEYIPAFVPPKFAANFDHDAWVSSLDVLSSADSTLKQPMVLSGSYDGLVRVWNASSQIIAQSTYLGDSRLVAFTKAVKFVSPTRIASGGMDRTIRLLQFKEPTTIVESNGSITHEADLIHHKQMVLSLDSQTSDQRLLSASVDQTLALWNTDPSTAPNHNDESDGTSAKRQKKGAKSSFPSLIAPLAIFKGHTHHVTGVIFSPHATNQAYSISSDNTLKTWSLATTSVLDNRPLSDPLYSLTAITNMHLLAVGSSRGDITLLDPRTSTASIKVSTVRQAHSVFVSSLSKDPTSEYRFVSGGYDAMVKVWDIRSLNSATLSIDRRDTSNSKDDKVFAVRWDAEIGILSAGSDEKVRIDR